MKLSQKIKAFSTLGRFLQQFRSDSFIEDNSLCDLNVQFADLMEGLINNVHIYNPWFTPEFTRFALVTTGDSLKEKNIIKWVSAYPSLANLPPSSLRIGIIMAGNLPLVGFQDFISAAFSGHKLVAKLSSKDDKLLPALTKIIKYIEPEFEDFIYFEEEKLSKPDAVIATGSDNSSRYFEYYFGKYPHIIRKNRNSIAVLTGNETKPQLRKLADDIFMYFGLGCRSVSKLFIPVTYNIAELLKNFEQYSYLANHNKYANNYEYQRAMYLINQVPHYDTGFLLLKEDTDYSSPVGCLYYESYDDMDHLQKRILQDKDRLQCIVTNDVGFSQRTDFGITQKPMLWDYADNADVLRFLLNLYNEE